MKQEDVLVLGEARGDGHQPGWSGVFHEERDPRYDARVTLPFKLVVDGLVVEGNWFSATTVVVRDLGTLGDGKQTRLSTLFDDSGEREAIMLIALSGFSINVNVWVRKLVGEPGSATVMLRFTRMHESARESLKRVIRYFQSGRLPTPDDILAAESEETPFGGSNLPQTEAASRSVRQSLALAASCLVLLGVIAASGVSIYNRIFVVRSEFATVTAPKLDVLAAATGRLIVDAPEAGQPVVRDQLLYTIQSPDLESDMELLDAQIEALKGAPVTASLEAEAANDASLIGAADTASVVPEDQTTQVQLLVGQRKALELRRQELSDFSACDCTVVWTAENGSWVKQGEPVVVLARTAPEAMQIEALVKLSKIKSVTPGQTAYFRDPSSGALQGATVERVSLDPERQPRYGFPDWLRQDPTVGSVTLSLHAAVSPNWVGQPIDVMFVRPIEIGGVAGIRQAALAESAAGSD